jgi:hypothetical protein
VVAASQLHRKAAKISKLREVFFGAAGNVSIDCLRRKKITFVNLCGLGGFAVKLTCRSLQSRKDFTDENADS